MNQSKMLLTIGIVLAVVAGIVAVKALKQKGVIAVSSEKARSKGDAQAGIKIVEYIDFQCPMCALGAQKLRDYMEKYPGKIHVEMHYYPLDMHKHAFVASQYAQCAAEQGKFWEMHDVLVDKQKSWSPANNAAALFDIYAKEIGLDMDRFKACLPSERVNQEIEEDKKQGRALMVRSTPTYFVNGKMVVGIKVLQEELDTLLGVSKPAEPPQTIHP